MKVEAQTGSPLQEFELEELSLLETIDHVLSHGLVISGEVVISVANIDLIYLGVSLLLGSVDTIDRVLAGREQGKPSA
jgi:gas vesicle structural protein